MKYCRLTRSLLSWLHDGFIFAVRHSLKCLLWCWGPELCEQTWAPWAEWSVAFSRHQSGLSSPGSSYRHVRGGQLPFTYFSVLSGTPVKQDFSPVVRFSLSLLMPSQCQKTPGRLPRLAGPQNCFPASSLLTSLHTIRQDSASKATRLQLIHFHIES